MEAKAKRRISDRKKHTITGKRNPQSKKKKPVNIKGKPVGAKRRKRVIDIKKRVINSRKLVRRDKNGHILPGSGSNGGGRPKGSLAGARVSEIRQSIARVEIERRKPEKKRNFKTWLDHLVDKSYDDTSLAIAILGKVHPTLKSIEQVNLDVGVMDEAARDDLQERYSRMRFDI